MSELLTSDALHPFKSFLMVELDPEPADVSMRPLLRAIEKAFKVNPNASGNRRRRRLSVVPANPAIDRPAHGFLHYRESRQVPWAKIGLADVTNHLVIVVRHDRLLAIAITEGSRREALMKSVRSGRLGPLRLIRPGRLKAAFVVGDTRTLWLKGMHRRASYKPDNKVLTGSNLRDALDPNADQTYRYTAIRSEASNPAIGDVIGLAVDQSRVWIGPSTDFDDFTASVVAVLEEVRLAIATAEEPLPVVAAAADDLAELDGPFDMSITPPELLDAPAPLDAQQILRTQELEVLAFRTTFDVHPNGPATFEADVSRDGNSVGRIGVEVVRNDEATLPIVEVVSVEPGQRTILDGIVGSLRDPEVLTIRFDSGHVVADRQVFVVRHRDIPFDGWLWADLADYDVGKEKPDPLTAIGTQDSLFCWAMNTWPSILPGVGSRAWLLCDDRPGETADFVHLDDEQDVPILTLVHVKSANNTSVGRGISVVAYETVGAQAVKNLRHLDAHRLDPVLTGASLPGEMAWHDGSPCTRKEFVDRIVAIGTNVRRRVVIVQPHQLRSRLGALRSGASANAADVARGQQLDTMLLGVAANVRGLGAEFYVVGDAR
jgi:hypothetical protein